MKPKTIVAAALLAFVGASVVYLVVQEARGKPGPGSPPAADGPLKTETPAAAEAGEARHKVVAYYFHGRMRCKTCRTIEAFAKKAMEAGFPEAVKDGGIEFRVVNVDEPENEHYTRDFPLAARGLVLAEFEGAKRKQWKNLQRVWELVHDEDAFLAYVQEETRGYLRAGP